MPDKWPEKSTVVITHGDIASPQPPQVPEYELLRCVGRGAFGEVWLARNVLDTYRAIKIVYRKSFQDIAFFEREFHGITKFEKVSGTHPGLLNVLQVGPKDAAAAGYFYYAMEVADDEVSGRSIDPQKYQPRTLSGEIARRGRLPLEECVSLGLSLTTALEHLHKNGLIHRDIKPANIIYVKGVSKLADIGLVTGIGTPSFVGTRGYIPPEGPGKPTADVFSLGKVLYTISTGKDPEEDFPELPGSLETGEFEKGFLEFNKILLRACERDLEKRYPSAQAMHADLELLSRGKPVPQSHTWLIRQWRGLFSPRSQVPERSPDRRRQLRIVIRISFATVLLAIVIPSFVVPYFVRARLGSQENAIFNNLRIIDGAKEQWALENKKHPGDQITDQDLAPFLRGGKILSVVGETYFINPVGTTPTAKAPVRVGNYPPGTTIMAPSNGGGSLPERIAALPVGTVLSIVYLQNPPSPPAQFTKPQFQFEIFTKRKSDASFVQVKDGDSLASEADGYLIVTRPLSRGYLYIFQVDSSGKKDWLFPENSSSKWSSGKNPVGAEQVIQVPPARNESALYLDKSTGIEHVYAIFSATRWPELEEALAKPASSSPVSQVAVRGLTVQEPNGLGLRGVLGTRPTTTPFDAGEALERVFQGQTYKLPVSGQVFESSSTILVIERWFRHVNP